MSPSVMLGLVLGSLYGLLCHAFVGQRWRQLPVYWVTGLLGFFAGYALAVLGGIEIARLGTVPLLEATLGSCLALGLVAGIMRRRLRSSVGNPR